MAMLQRMAGELRSASAAGLLLVVIATLLGFLAAAHTAFDWFADFRMVYALCALVPLALWLRHDRRIAATAAAVVLVNGSFLIPWAPQRAPECETELTAISINAFGTFADEDSLVAELRRHDADIVFVAELVSGVRRKVAEIYPSTVVFDESPSVGLFTKHAVLEAELLRSPGRRPYIRALLQTPNGPLRVIGVHAKAPFEADSALDRNANLLDIAVIARATEEPLIVLGDLNLTMFSPHYAPLETAGLQNVRLGRGVHGTWPSVLPLRIPIDHVLHNERLETCHVEVGENFSSDHLPLVAGMRWRVSKSSLPTRELAAR